MSRAAIFVVAGDAGGANALLPVIGQLRTAGAELTLAGYATAPGLWRAKGEETLELQPDVTLSVAAELLRAHGAGLLLTGTSINGIDLEHVFIQAARLVGIPSLALLDFWSNYAPRFSSADGRLDCLPQAIAIMDEQAAREMKDEGFPPEVLRITGQPLFDSLADLRAEFGPERRRDLRARLGVGEGERLVVFACQPLNDVFHQGARAAIGYDEWDVLPPVADALDTLRTESPVRLILLPHPREPKGKYDGVAARAGVSLALTDVSSREMALASDLVVGMNSMLLMESVLLGTRAVSVQPGLRVADALPVSRTGVIPRVEQLEELQNVLREALLAPGLLTGGRRDAGERMFVGRAAARVARLALEMLAGGEPA